MGDGGGMGDTDEAAFEIMGGGNAAKEVGGGAEEDDVLPADDNILLRLFLFDGDDGEVRGEVIILRSGKRKGR